MPEEDKKISVISINQSGGITAHTVNISAAPAPTLTAETLFINHARGSEYHSRIALVVTHLDGRSRGNDTPQEINFFISSRSTRWSVIFRLRAPVLSHSVSDIGPHQSPIRFKALGIVLIRESSPALGNLSCPRKLSVPRRVQGLGSQIHWLSLSGANPISGSRRGRTIESQHH
jgi:hypothetical protein